MPPYRPPSEAYSILIRATRGCPHNKCAFCNMYKHLKFKRRPLQDILDDIVIASTSCPYYTTLFIGDSNSIVLSTADLIQILDTAYANFSKLKRVTMYARAKTIAKSKTLEDLKELKEHGLTRLHVGLETGDDELLALVQKGATTEDMIKAGKLIVESGISLCFYIMPGLGGKEYSNQHVIGTANVLNQVNPDYIRLRTFIPNPGTILWDKVQNKELTLLTPEEVLQEEYDLIKKLEVKSNFVSDHMLNYPVYDNGLKELDGKLPEDKKKLLTLIQNTFKEMHENPTVKSFYEGHKKQRELQALMGTL